MTEAAFLSAIRLHVTGNLALIRAAEDELIKNKVGLCTASHSLLNSAFCQGSALSDTASLPSHALGACSDSLECWLHAGVARPARAACLQ